MTRPSLDSISKRYGQFETFGHKDYEEAKKAGYSNQEIKNWLNQDLNRLHPNNKPGGISGLYDEISRDAVDYTKAVNIDRGAKVETGGMTGLEYDYQKAIDLANISAQSGQTIATIGKESALGVAGIQKQSALGVAGIQKDAALGVADIDKQIKEMQLESAENIAKLESMNKSSLANTALNQSILSGLVNAFNF